MTAVTKWVANDLKQNTSVLKVIQSTLSKASGVDIAVSYALLSGWELLEPALGRLASGRVRMLVTGQLAITQPQALRRALETGVQLRIFDGRIYHPKVYLFYGEGGRRDTAIVGSANISESALTTSVEAGVSTTDRGLVRQMSGWFDELFNDAKYSTVVDDPPEGS